MIELDDINRKILQHLEADGRISNNELAEIVGLSTSACLRRVQELERTGLITGYRAVLDRKRLGNAIIVFVMVGLSAHQRKDVDAFERAMQSASEVRECHNVTGGFEFLLRIEVADLETYKEFATKTLGAFSHVNSVTSYVAVGTSKDLRG